MAGEQLLHVAAHRRSTAKRPAAINRDQCAVDVARGLAAEPQAAVGDVLLAAVALHRHGIDRCLLELRCWCEPRHAFGIFDRAGQYRVDAHARRSPRSEEHTSELQSLMRISYAVFCLKKKINTTHEHNYDAISTQVVS